MKKFKHLLFLTLCVGMITVSCKNGNNGIITMELNLTSDYKPYSGYHASREIGLYISADKANIDFGDGTKKTYTIKDANKAGVIEIKYTYASYGKKDITITSTNLTSISCSTVQLTNLDVSKNPTLANLYCDYNQLACLDVSQNTALQCLLCFGNQFTSLDVSKNIALQYLACDDNQLTSLDVSKNTSLIYLRCSNNQLTSLDVSKNTVLKQLVCNRNQLSRSALNTIIADLPNVMGETDEEGEQPYFCIFNNPGSKGCNISDAQNKGWNVEYYM